MTRRAMTVDEILAEAMIAPTDDGPNIAKLRAYLAVQIANGMMGRHWSWGPKAYEMSSEERAALIIKMDEGIANERMRPLNFGDLRWRENPAINLWLDDVRPCPPGWLHVKTVSDAIEVLQTGNVVRASLDHDLGACETCLGGMDADEWLDKHDFQSMPHCDHFGTGYTLVCWMEETGNWPEQKPTVHSRNPVGRARMQQVIDKAWDGPRDQGGAALLSNLNKPEK